MHDRAQRELVSVIITVYNSEKFLPYCVDSVLSQSYENLEVILVDDGSTDSSYSLCEGFALKDKRCKVIHKNNGGAWSAKNAGLEVVSGDFVTFIDSDDYCHRETISLMHRSLLDNPSCDLAMVGIVQTESYNENTSDTIVTDQTILSQDDLFTGLFSERNIPFAVMCNKMYRAKKLDQVCCGPYLMTEDFDFNIKAFLNIRSAVYVRNGLYFWVQRQGSLTHTSESMDASFERVANVCYSNYQSLSQENKRFAPYLLNHLYNCLSNWINYSTSIERGRACASFCRQFQKGSVMDYCLARSIPFSLKAYNLARINLPTISQLFRIIRHSLRLAL